MPNHVDPKILLQNPEVLFAGYLKIRADWKADADPEKPNLTLDEWGSSKAFAFAMECYAKDERYVHERLRWEIMLCFGYEAYKLWRKHKDDEGQIDVGFSVEFGDVVDNDSGFDFTGSIKPD